MKKAIIAGAASAVLAAMPVVGVFADTLSTGTDTLEVTVDPACTMTRTGAEKYSNTIALGATANLNGANSVNSSTYTIVCNRDNGYSVTAVMTDLSNGGQDKFEYNATAGTAGTWTASTLNTINGIAGSTSAISATLQDSGDNEGKYVGTLISSTKFTPAAGDSAVVSYAATARNNQATGTYNGTATYTLVGATN